MTGLRIAIEMNQLTTQIQYCQVWELSFGWYLISCIFEIGFNRSSFFAVFSIQDCLQETKPFIGFYRLHAMDD